MIVTGRETRTDRSYTFTCRRLDPALLLRVRITDFGISTLLALRYPL
jgi:hypothetical protein